MLGLLKQISRVHSGIDELASQQRLSGVRYSQGQSRLQVTQAAMWKYALLSCGVMVVVSILQFVVLKKLGLVQFNALLRLPLSAAALSAAATLSARAPVLGTDRRDKHFLQRHQPTFWGSFQKKGKYV